jgi:type I restriction enzyme S subunit
VAIKIGNVSGDKYANMPTVVPPPDEQRAIATFLDRETERIDALIEKKERLIDLLEEKRTALISRVVTKGLDGDVEMQDSGVEWLGKIPAHWETANLMHLTPADRKIMYGIILPGPHHEGGVPIIKGGNVKPGELERENLNCTDPEIDAENAKSRVQADDIVYAIRGSIGEAEQVPKELEGANLTQDAARISPKDDIDERWLLHVVRSAPFFAQLEARALGATVKGINIRDLKRASVPAPPLNEQLEIAKYLDAETSRIDALKVRIDDGIDRLKEYRTALISAAVTGQIDVRKEVGMAPVE